ncbi:MAG: PLP-dependent cysteine synthase family protein [Planctomycetota bacterium]|jgi:cysteine synthase B
MSILSAIGNTPLVELTHLNRKSPRVRIFGKLEGVNPGGSVKDRPAYYMIKKAEESGQLTAGKVILEPTSGNTGIALAMIGAAKGYPVKLCMPECVSTERQHILQALGAEVVLTPAKEGTDGAIREAHRLFDAEPETYYMPNQFENESNVLAHYETTGPEVFSQTNGEIDAFVAGMGTTGTLMGVYKYLKEKKPQARVVGIEPPEGHTIQGLKNMNESIVPGIYDTRMLDEKITVEDGEAFETSGTVVVILPDRGDRYLSTTLFRSICAKCPP